MGSGGEDGLELLEPKSSLSGQAESEKLDENGTPLPLFSFLISQALAVNQRGVDVFTKCELRSFHLHLLRASYASW